MPTEARSATDIARDCIAALEPRDSERAAATLADEIIKIYDRTLALVMPSFASIIVQSASASGGVNRISRTQRPCGASWSRRVPPAAHSTS